jgi:hypothetical protein
METVKYGAYCNRRDDGIVWFKTTRPLEAGFYRRHARRGEAPDACIAESVPELIMKVYPWIHELEADFQLEVGKPGLDDKDNARISQEMTDQLVQRLDPDDEAVWVDEPHWVKHLEPD